MKRTHEDLLKWLGLEVGNTVCLRDNQCFEVMESRFSRYVLENANKRADICSLIGIEYTIIDKPKLSDAERVILENLDAQFKWLAKDESGSLYAYSTQPTRHTSVFNNNIGKMSTFEFPHLFQFIQWKDEPYNIQDLLNER